MCLPCYKFGWKISKFNDGGINKRLQGKLAKMKVEGGNWQWVISLKEQIDKYLNCFYSIMYHSVNLSKMLLALIVTFFAY